MSTAGPLSPRRFEVLVAEALDALPPELAALMDNVAVLVADRGAPPDLLGLYEGVPLTERDEYGAGGFTMPDCIHLYRLALCELCDDEEHLREEVLVLSLIHI